MSRVRIWPGLAFALVALGVAQTAQAGEDVLQPLPDARLERNGPAPDARVRRLDYIPGQVVTHAGHFGYATTIRFGPGERIANVAVGDPDGWQTLPNAAQTLLFVKPLLEDADTNMTVVTDREVYHFALELAEDGVPVFEIDLAPAPRQPPQTRPSPPTAPALPNPFAPGTNTDYALKGDADLAPTAIFDDGRFTYAKFADATERPALFGVGPDRRERLLNTHMRGPLTVIEGVQRQITVRLGERAACLLNRGYPDTDNRFQSDLANLRPPEVDGTPESATFTVASAQP